MTANVISRSFADIHIEIADAGHIKTNDMRAFHTKCTIWTDFNKNEMTYYVVSVRENSLKNK